MEKSRCVLQFGVVYVGYDSIRSFLKKKKKKTSASLSSFDGGRGSLWDLWLPGAVVAGPAAGCLVNIYISPLGKDQCLSC